MSKRSIRRAQEREAAKQGRPGRSRRTGIVGGTALGATAVLAPAADAATFTVSNTNDAGTGSLRQAVIDANIAPGPDDVVFQSGLSGSILLTTGAVYIGDAVDIQGPGASQLTVDASGDSRIFSLYNFADPDEAVRIAGLQITGGAVPGGSGGAILSEPGASGNAAELTLADSVLTGNYAGERGGAVYLDEGSLTVSGSSLTDNRTAEQIGDYGGAIYVGTTDGDQAVELSIRDTTITGNEAWDGGGVYTSDLQRSALIERTTISNNSAVDDSGGIFMSGPYAPGGSVTIDSTTISDNRSDQAAGGAVFWSEDAPLLIRNSTISGNSVTDAASQGYGGGVRINSAEAQIQNSTVVGNSAALEGGGIWRGAVSDVSISSSIVSGNTAPAGPDLAENVAPPPDFEVGFSLIGSTAGATVTETPAGSNIVGVDPQLGPLANNGGPTATHLPALTSPVIDGGIANSLATDQRGLPRTVDLSTSANRAGSDATDIGAAEIAGAACQAATVPSKTGTEAGETVTGSDGPDSIAGLGGDDTLAALAGNDCASGDAGADTVTGGAGDDLALGSDGKDRVRGQGGKDTAKGEAGKDNVAGGGGNDKAIGGAGKDTVKGGRGKDKLKGNAGKDKLKARDGEKDRVNCGAGNDKASVDEKDKVSPNCEDVAVK